MCVCGYISVLAAPMVHGRSSRFCKRAYWFSPEGTTRPRETGRRL